MLWDAVFWLGLIASAAIGFVYFRDLGDVSQMVLNVKRENMIRFIRNEYRLTAIGLGAGVVMAVSHLSMGGGPSWLFWIAIVVLAFLYGFPYIWVHLGLRNQRNTAKYFSIDEAMELVSPSSGVIVIEKKGVARAHPDSQIMRPHLAGNTEGLDGENVVMTYCAMANLGIGYTPEIGGDAVKMEVLAQHGNNLILRDNTTGEPIQHIYGYRERDGKDGPAMKAWPTFRMTFRGFQKAYPEGTVFLNKPSANPLLRVFDMFSETVFSAGIARQHNEAAPVMDNMSRSDNRLPNKTYVWGIGIGDDAVCFTDDFIIGHEGPINVTVDGDRSKRSLVHAQELLADMESANAPASELASVLAYLAWAQALTGDREGALASTEPLKGLIRDRLDTSSQSSQLAAIALLLVKAD
jgi:hypothetical protein